MPQKPYGMICPISHACEMLEPRWTIQILTQMWAGSTRFNDIRRGVGNISTSLLAKRLRELEDIGLVERVEDYAAGTVDYFRTDKAIKLEPALNALAEWAQCNIDADIALRDTDVSAMMWNVRRWKINLQELPNRRVVIRFHFNDDPPLAYAAYWLVAEPGNALPELCSADPGFDVDLFVETNVMSLGAIITGRTSIDREIEQGGLFMSGDVRLSRTMHRWLRLSAYASVEGISPLRTRGERQAIAAVK